MTDFSHIDGKGRIRMVDVSGKPVVRRIAVARGFIACSPETVRALREGTLGKGEALAAARVAGIAAAKRTSDLIPLCHPLPIDDVRVDLAVEDDGVAIETAITCTARTGVEMEALTAAAVTALTLYDMCKAVDKAMRIGPIELVSKTKEQA
jgi:cyclic pyranopterin phosphate synthase